MNREEFFSLKEKSNRSVVKMIRPKKNWISFHIELYIGNIQLDFSTDQYHRNDIDENNPESNLDFLEEFYLES